MTSNERNKLRIYLEKHISESLDKFQIETGLIVDDITMTFSGVRVTLLDDDKNLVTE